jgi:hypothetical protein
MTQGDIDSSNEVVSGALPILSCVATVLFDSRVTHSFVSHSFVKVCNLEAGPLDVNLAVSTLVGRKLICNSIVKGCLVNIEVHVMLANLVVFEMLGFDIILCMDWLSANHACVDCFRKEVVFKPPLGSEFKFRGNRGDHLPKLVSAMQACRLISKGCTDFLACETEEKQEVKVKDVPIVLEFIDVFPEELPGLPPDREIEFSIDLLPGTTSISRAPYRMAHSELCELKEQLQELLDRFFI